MNNPIEFIVTGTDLQFGVATDGSVKLCLWPDGSVTWREHR